MRVITSDAWAALKEMVIEAGYQDIADSIDEHLESDSHGRESDRDLLLALQLDAEKGEDPFVASFVASALYHYRTKERFEDIDLDVGPALEMASDVLSAIDEQIEVAANASAAEAFSTLGDDDQDRLQDKGFTDWVAIAQFEHEIAVNGDVIVDDNWERELALDFAEHPRLWNEVGTGPLTTWLKTEGFRFVPSVGGTFSQEEEVPLERVLEQVALDFEVELDHVKWVARMERYGDFYYTTVKGTLEVWAR